MNGLDFRWLSITSPDLLYSENSQISGLDLMKEMRIEVQISRREAEWFACSVFEKITSDQNKISQIRILCTGDRYFGLSYYWDFL